MDVTDEPPARTQPGRVTIDNPPTPNKNVESQPGFWLLRHPLQRWWTQFRSDAFGKHASIQPLAGWLLLALVGLVTYLTIEYAPGAFERTQRPHGTDPRGVIAVETGYLTVGIVALLALMVAFEPHIADVFSGGNSSSRGRWLAQQSGFVRSVAELLLSAGGTLWRFPSQLWSFLDYLFARPIALLAGATQHGAARRYGWGALVMITSVAAGLLSPPPLGLCGVGVGILAVLSIVRRWSWIEADRERFLIERGDRQEARRIGFGEDLRDEALVALTLLFVLIPLGLRQIQLGTCTAGSEHCAFIVEGEAELPSDLLAQFLAWLGYFGAEMAKSLPFVDWSEVFQVANDSPIKPRTTLGAQVVFVMRATLDLLLLAAVLQAVRIAGRLRNQRTAFEAGRLPILEPFAEARELRRAAADMDDALGLPLSEQPGIHRFPDYDVGRLRELVRGNNPDINPVARQVAAALLQYQHPGEQTETLFTEVAANEPDPEMRDWVLRVASCLPQHRDRGRGPPDGQHLKALLADRWEETGLRASAARALGRIGFNDATCLLIERLMDRREHPRVRADSGVALTKIQPAEALGPVRELVGLFNGSLEGDELIAAMATAFALARLTPSEDAWNIAAKFDGPLRGHAHRAARIQPEPVDAGAAGERESGPFWDQMVRIVPGSRPFPSTLRMGSPHEDHEASPLEKPTREITMKRPFAIGRCPVTQQEYLGFCLATGRKSPDYSEMNRWPVILVNWRDAVAYCNWLERITGELYRLPTEVEWEYACRAGTMTRYSWGDDWDDNRANSNRSGLNRPSDVGSYDPNDWGLSDMQGNVFEWCADPWHESHAGRPDDDSAWLRGGDFSRRVLRGGSWGDAPRYLRAATRNNYSSDIRSNYSGFRLARWQIS